MIRTLETRLRELCDSIGGEYGLSLTVLDTGEKIALNAEKRMIAASTIKIPLLALLLKDGKEGRLDLEKLTAIDPVNRVPGGIVWSLSPTLQLSLFDCAVLMMVLSDNAATNQVIDAVGMARADAFIAEMGWTSSHLGRKMETPGALLPDGTREQNYTSAADLADMMERIAAGKLIDAEISRTMEQIMAGQRNGKFRPALPCVKHFDPRERLKLPPEGMVLLSAKSGSLPGLGVSADAGILTLPSGRRAVLTMVTRADDYDLSVEVTGKVAQTVVAALTEKP